MSRRGDLPPSRELQRARVLHRSRCVNWGFYWALWCAVLWGAWYVPGTAIWYETPFVDIDSSNPKDFLLAAAVITSLGSLATLFFLFIWLITLEKLEEYRLTVRNFHISKWFYIGAIFGGPCALFGSYLAMGYVGPVFAAVAALMYPVVGAPLARFWYHEKITVRVALGIIIILSGGISIYVPGLFVEASASTHSAWLGYLGGAMAAVGWGVEGAVAGRILDVSDPDVGITIKFTAEAFYWVIIILLWINMTDSMDITNLITSTLNSQALLWILLAGASFAFCYVAWYKSFPLIGVARGQAVAALYGIFAVIFISIFTFDLPEWYFLLGLVLTVLGCFIMFTESPETLEVIRSTGHL